MCPGSTKRGRKTHRYYRCSTPDRHGIQACKTKPLAADAIDRFVVERIAKLTAEKGFVHNAEELLRARTESRRAAAENIQWAIDRGEVPDAATVARRLGLTRARVSQLLGLCFLAPSIQEEVLGLEAVDGVEPMAERALREAGRAGTWAEQQEAWTAHRPP